MNEGPGTNRRLARLALRIVIDAGNVAGKPHREVIKDHTVDGLDRPSAYSSRHPASTWRITKDSQTAISSPGNLS